MGETVEMYDGTEVEVEHVDALAEGGARFDVEAADGRKWRIDVDRHGDFDIVTTWRDGQLADVDVPEWMGDLVTRLRGSA
ncbi:hypothetical protein [Halomicrobium urmianum]|uniref:hypothetical protein n=1 Tax=Halomicrobium urmianum TaxID=1586233 RepID=UPI001CD9A8D9|nr:hypothetical protein [Halomicrobium urmianum]